MLNDQSISDFVNSPEKVINASAPYQQLHEEHAKVKKEIIALKESIGLYEKMECTRQEHVYFLKTSKTGSTTLANILIRLGLRVPGTNFLLGESSNGGLFFTNAYMPFSAETCFMGQNLENRPKFDISYVHMRYNKTAVDIVMQPDTKKISILRNPLDNFVSSWRYYNGLMKDMRRMLPMYAEDHKEFIETKDADFISEMEQFLLDPHKYLKPLHFAHGAYMFTYHPQLLFFGYPTYLLSPGKFKLDKLVAAWLSEIVNDFDHILILEDLDASLAVLMIKFCWNVDDVAHLKLNSMRKEEKKLSKQAEELQRQYNWGDWMLYEFFTQKHYADIREIGIKKVEYYKSQIIARSEEISNECIQQNVATSPLQWISTPRVRPEKAKNQTCHHMTKDTSGFLIMEHILRWKEEYPEYFKNMPAPLPAPLPRVAAGIRPTPPLPKKARSMLTPPRKRFPRLCNGPKNFIEYLDKQERYAMSYFGWETNEWDIRPEWPDYIKQYSQSYTVAEHKLGDLYRKLWNRK